MKERPILFSAPMVRAILEGRKTQTRMVAKLADFGTAGKPWMYRNSCGNFVWGMRASDTLLDMQNVRCPYGQPGDRLWVRETWRKGWTYGGDYPTAEYLADNAAHIGWEQRPVMAVPHQPYPASHGGKWKPSIHMPRWASRILLEVVSVRVERLRDISEADAKAEGVIWNDAGQYWQPSEDINCPCCFAYGAYAELWESINGSGSWDADPWVWVVEFRMVTP